MEFDNVKRASTINQEQSADYWREKTECLEEWVCELLRKNQALRMDLQKQQYQHRHFQEAPLEFSLISLYRSPFLSARPAFRAESPKLVVDAGTSTVASLEEKAPCSVLAVHSQAEAGNAFTRIEALTKCKQPLPAGGAND